MSQCIWCEVEIKIYSLLVSNLQLQETVSHSAEKNSKQLKPEVIPAHISSPHFQLNHKHF